MIFLKVSKGKHIILVKGAQNWKLPTQLIIFLDFWAKILRIAHPVNYSYLPPWFVLSAVRKKICTRVGAQNWKLPAQLIIFLFSGAKILRIAHPVNYSYWPPWFEKERKMWSKCRCICRGAFWCHIHSTNGIKCSYINMPTCEEQSCYQLLWDHHFSLCNFNKALEIYSTLLIFDHDRCLLLLIYMLLFIAFTPSKSRHRVHFCYFNDEQGLA